MKIEVTASTGSGRSGYEDTFVVGTFQVVGPTLSSCFESIPTLAATKGLELTSDRSMNYEVKIIGG